MNIEQLINDKIGRKQIIAVIAMILLDGHAEMIVGVAVLAIATQVISDWKFPRTKEEAKE